MKNIDDEIIDRFLNGNYVEDDLKKLNEWLDESDEHVKYLFTTEEFLQLNKYEIFSEKTNLDIAEKRLLKTIKNNEQAETKRKLFLSGIKKYIAAAVILITVSLGISILVFKKDSYQKEQLIVVSAEKGIYEFNLPDGSKVWLNDNSVLKYFPDFTTERYVFLEGEAYFEVQKNPDKPLTVESNLLKVSVLGTSFNFKSPAQSEIAEVSLINGEVQVKGNNNEGMIFLSPGQRAEVNKHSGRMTVQQVDVSLDAVWHDDLIPFSQASLFYISEVLERFYDIHIVLSPDLDTRRTYSGVIRRKDVIEDVLNSLQNVIPLTFKRVGERIYLFPEQN
ncbi:MAG: FecR domain-containing protein [Tannerellaceae bacterium]|nr:FecR domain-containing protein [Tannerellaceae bacterium]